MSTIKALLAVSVLAAAGAANAANLIGTFDVNMTGDIYDLQGNATADGSTPGSVGQFSGTGIADAYDDGFVVITIGQQAGIPPYATLDITVYGSRIIDEMHLTAAFSPSGFDSNGATYNSGLLTTTYCGEIPNIATFDPTANGFCDRDGLTGPLNSPTAFDTVTGSLSMAGGVFHTTQLLVSGELRFGRDFTLSNFYPNQIDIPPRPPMPTPIPAAAWLFGSCLIGLTGAARKRKSA